MRGRLLTVLAVAALAAFVPVDAVSAATAAETAWTPVVPAPPVPDDFRAGRLWDAAAVSPTDVWAVGDGWGEIDQPLITHWTGAGWDSVEAPSMPDLQYGLTAVDAVSARDVWAIGNGYTTSDPVVLPVPVMGHYDGTKWSMTPVPTPSSDVNVLKDIDMLSATDGWAVGLDNGPSVSQPLAMRWRNGRWTRVSVPLVEGASFTHVYARAANDVWAVGDLGDPAFGQGKPGEPALVMHFDGTRWTRVAVPFGGDPEATNQLWSVTAVSATEVWAVGDSCVWGWDATVCHPLILRLSRGTWQVVPSAGDHGTNLRDVVARSANDVWVTGYDLVPGGEEADHVEHWDGQRFTTVPADGAISIRGGLASALEAVTRMPGSAELWAVGWQDGMPHVIRHG